MKRGLNRATELTMEVVVGTFVFMVLLVLCIFTIVLSRENIFKRGVPFEVVFPEVMGLRDGDNVVIRGMVVGTIQRLVLTEQGVHVYAQISDDYKLEMHEDYEVRVEASSVLGGRYMEIDEGAPSSPLLELKKGETYTGLPPADLIGAASDVIDQVKEALDKGGIVENFEKTMANIKDISEKINKGQGTIGKLVNDPELYDNANVVVAEIKTTLTETELLKNIEDAVLNLKEVSEKVNKGDGTIAKLVNDPSLYDNANEAVDGIKKVVSDPEITGDLKGTLANLKDITGKINEGKGTIGKLVNDDELYNEIKRLVGEARATVDDIRETTPIVTFSSIFFGAF